jgi:hypothetical protein
MESAITSSLVLTLIAVLAFIAARSHHLEVDNKEIYKYPAVIGYLMLGIGLAVVVVAFLPSTRGHESLAWMLLHFWPFPAFAFCAAIYFFRYRIILDDVSFEYGALKRSRVLRSDVIDTETNREGRSPELFVYLRNGKRLRFSGLLGDFDSFASEMYLQSLPDAGPLVDSPAKLNDRKQSRLYSVIFLLIVWVAFGAILWFGSKTMGH